MTPASGHLLPTKSSMLAGPHKLRLFQPLPRPDIPADGQRLVRVQHPSLGLPEQV